MPDDITEKQMAEGLRELAEEATREASPDDPPEGDEVDDSPADEPETFPRSYVEQLRQENGRYRQRAQRSDELAERLHVELVRATGRLADETDLPFDESHLDSAEALTAAIDELLTRKPHLAARRPAGSIGQGVSEAGGSVDLAAILRGNTR